METLVPVLVVIGLIISLVNAVKMATAGEWKNVGTLLMTYAIGIAVTVMFANSDFGKTFEIAGYVLGELDFLSLVIVGVFWSGAASTTYDALPTINTPTLGTTPPPYGG